jgi:SAM-dependent methyltransferase
MRIFKGLERIDRSLPDHYFSSHLARYSFVRDRIGQSSRVLDLGCGIGYGACFICESTAGLVALDIDIEAIRTAKSSYGHPKIHFVLSQGERLPFRDASFEGVISFEVIEHLRSGSHTDYLSEINRVLKSNGIAFLSTPNRKFTAGTANPYHKKEFYLDELQSLLSCYFPKVELYGQRCLNPAARIYGGKLAAVVNEIKELLGIQFLLPQWAKRVAEFCLTGSTMAKVDLGDYEFIDQQIEDCQVFIAVCYKRV